VVVCVVVVSMVCCLGELFRQKGALFRQIGALFRQIGALFR